MSGGERETRILYRGSVIALTAIFVGLCTVVGGALMPGTWPPQNWFASIAAALLIALTFAVGIIIPGFLDAMSQSVEGQSIGEFVKKAWKERTFKAITVAILLAVVALSVWLLTPITALDRIVKDDDIGGLDLAQYCQSYGYDTNSEEVCSWKIPLNEACDWEHHANGLRFEFASDNPYSGSCYDPQGEDIGGVSDMGGYCQEHFWPSINVDAIVVNDISNRKSWVCQIAIDKNLACSWLYQKGDLLARKDGSIWRCYQ
jgi:hypothetical protein